LSWFVGLLWLTRKALAVNAGAFSFKIHIMNRKRLFYDIETSFCKGHFWRPGFNQRIGPEQITDYAKIISIHWKWEGEKEVHNLDWGLDEQCDKKMLEVFVKELDKADEIVTHNGKRFDTPWIRTRCLFHGIPMRHQYREVDTYKLCKKYLNLPSYSLKEVCKYFDLPAKIDPGGLQTWIDVVYKKDQAALDHLLYYGNGDITSLEAVFNKLNSYIPNLNHYSVLAGDEKFHCPECGGFASHNKRYTTAEQYNTILDVLIIQIVLRYLK
jgi:uncharacterized protein YprB with RNaseH-like and TPR domain